MANFYRKFSVLLEQTIADYKAQRISEVEYLERVTEIMRAVRDGRANDAPEVLRGSDLSHALFGALKEHIGNIEISGGGTRSVVREDAPGYGDKGNGDPIEGILAAAACQIEGIIRKHAIVRWRESVDAQNRMRNDLDDFLFALQAERGTKLSLAQMDEIIESTLRIARNRINDV